MTTTTTTVTKKQILNIAKDVKDLTRTEGGSYMDRLESLLLGNYDNVYTDSYGVVMVRLYNGNNVELLEII